MRIYNHDKLHKLTDSNPELKDRSDKVHFLPPNDEWDEFGRRKCLMVDVWADAIDCKQRQSAHESINAVVKYFRQFSKSLSHLREGTDFKRHLERSREIEDSFENTSRCHVAGGNSYVCFCNLEN